MRTPRQVSAITIAAIFAGVYAVNWLIGDDIFYFRTLILGFIALCFIFIERLFNIVSELEDRIRNIDAHWERTKSLEQEHEALRQRVEDLERVE